jgi:hypothetical protein
MAEVVTGMKRICILMQERENKKNMTNFRLAEKSLLRLWIASRSHKIAVIGGFSLIFEN